MEQIPVKPDLTIKAYSYAVRCHTETNHLYDGQPYERHLEMVVYYANKYLHLIPEKHRQTVIAACWAHDVIEDCRQTYNDVKAELGQDVAEIVYALTNEKGKTRKQRANDKYYMGILTTQYASFVKICDRLANVNYSIRSESSMIDAYRKEQNDFYAWLFSGSTAPMLVELNNILFPAT